MSLLLDALQRASKEKEKLAESRASGGMPSPEVTSEARDPFPSISLDPVAKPPTGSGLAELSIEPLQPKAESVTPKREVPIDPVVALVDEGFAATPPTVTALAESPAFEPAVRVVDSARADGSASPRDLEMLAAVAPPSQMPADVSLDRTTNGGPGSSGLAEKSLQTTATPAQNAPVKEPRPTEISPEIAREILGVTAKPKPKPRTMLLATVAVAVIAGYGAFWLGAFDRFLGSSASSLTPQNQPPAAAPVAAPVAAASLPPDDAQATSKENAKASPAEVKSVAAVVGDEKAPKQAHTAGSGSEPLSSSSRSTQRGNQRSVSSPVKPVLVARTSQPADLDLAYAALGEGRLTDARNLYRKALDRNPGERDALLGMAYISHREGDNESARLNYQQVLRLDPNNPVATSGLLAIAADGDLALSAARAREFAERAPDSAPALANLGAMLAREGRIAEAQQAYFKALTLEPDNPLYAYNLAVALDKLHKYSQAEAFYDRSLKLAEKANAAEKAGLPVKEAKQRLDEIRQGIVANGAPPVAATR